MERSLTCVRPFFDVANFRQNPMTSHLAKTPPALMLINKSEQLKYRRFRRDRQVSKINHSKRENNQSRTIAQCQ